MLIPVHLRVIHYQHRFSAIRETGPSIILLICYLRLFWWLNEINNNNNNMTIYIAVTLAISNRTE